MSEHKRTKLKDTIREIAIRLLHVESVIDIEVIIEEQVAECERITKCGATTTHTEGEISSGNS